ncbi:hypothetical protein MRY87_08970 [bacterium]|nr:hypothetical protein [bacterium]
MSPVHALHRSHARLLTGLVALIGVLFAPLPGIREASAEHISHIFFAGEKEVQAAYGLLYVGKTTREVPATWSYDEDRDGVLLSIEIPEDLPLQKTLVSGVMIDGSSQLQLSPLTIADLSTPTAVVPICERSTPLDLPESQRGLFEQLVEIRQRRVQVSRHKLERMFSAPLFERLHELEKGFDIGNEKPLSLELPMSELSERLDTLFHAITRYEMYTSNKQEQ